MQREETDKAYIGLREKGNSNNTKDIFFVLVPHPDARVINGQLRRTEFYAIECFKLDVKVKFRQIQ